MKKNTTPAIDAIGKLRLEGSITPPVWYQRIKTAKGTTNHVAVGILADLVSWHRPRVVLDETTNEVVRIERRFKWEKFYRSYAQWGTIFGVSKDTAEDAISLLVKYGLVLRGKTDKMMVGGMQISNVLYLEPVAKEIARLSNNAEEYVSPYLRQEVGRGENTPDGRGEKGGEGRGENTPDVNPLSTNHHTKNHYSANAEIAQIADSHSSPAPLEQSSTTEAHIQAPSADELFDQLESASGATGKPEPRNDPPNGAEARQRIAKTIAKAGQNGNGSGVSWEGRVGVADPRAARQEFVANAEPLVRGLCGYNLSAPTKNTLKVAGNLFDLKFPLPGGGSASPEQVLALMETWLRSDRKFRTPNVIQLEMEAELARLPAPAPPPKYYQVKVDPELQKRLDENEKRADEQRRREREQRLQKRLSAD